MRLSPRSVVYPALIAFTLATACSSGSKSAEIGQSSSIGNSIIPTLPGDVGIYNDDVHQLSDGTAIDIHPEDLQTSREAARAVCTKAANKVCLLSGVKISFDALPETTNAVLNSYSFQAIWQFHWNGNASGPPTCDGSVQTNGTVELVPPSGAPTPSTSVLPTFSAVYVMSPPGALQEPCATVI